VLSEDARLERLCRISSFVAVPALLAILTETQHRLQDSVTSFLVLPPFAVVIYLIFREPYGKWANRRSIVLLPCLGALVGQLSYRFFGLTPLGIAIATVCVMALQSLLRARMPPALALCVLAMLLQVQSFTYTLGVAEASIFIAVVFFLWRRFVVTRYLPTPHYRIEQTRSVLPEIRT
jgi:CBS-domain-containing membrane protein